ncbi:MAG: ethanolamine ammonia-lyase subunit EutB [Eubacteriales bacterium]|nr:ethanolamine ammonia-lyase subunit EutB [Christensenellaceae bacterium]MEA5066991.1 ethanolamine ammonia-lyase subunit EutB [Eubacteriales bacterium]
MKLSVRLSGTHYAFSSVREVMGKANHAKSGDRLAGVAAENLAERVAARVVLAHLTVGDVAEHPAVPYEQDEVTRIIWDDLNRPIYEGLKNLTLAELRELILSSDGDALKRIGRGLPSEAIAAVTKLMGNLDLIYAASKMVVTASCVTTIGMPGTLSARLQPNHPTDDVTGITSSVLEGLSYGSGDAVIGLNPVDASLSSVVAILGRFEEIKQKYQIPTQNCVLAHVTTQMEAVRKGAPCDLIFQSIAGSEKGNRAFGIDARMLEEARALALTRGTAHGPNVMYFETGQGSELSSDAHYGNDQLVMEARCYGLARRFAPFLVNTVVGFIGPEYLYDSREVVRAGLEDHFMGKLHGLSMGCDCCYTNHMKADQNDMDNLSSLLTAAGCNYIIGVPHADDVMLNYQSTSYHDVAALREIHQKQPIAAFARWLERWGIWVNGRPGPNFGDASVFL